MLFFVGGNEDSHLTGTHTSQYYKPAHVSMVYIFWDHENEGEDSFTFTFSSCPVKFCFDRPKALPPTNRPFKRRRALSDVDGDGNEGRKEDGFDADSSSPLVLVGHILNRLPTLSTTAVVPR